MTRRLNPALALWLGWARAMRLYHRYEVEGLEHLDAPGSKLLVGYHGRGIATDMIILNDVLFQRHGELPLSFLHSAVDRGTFWPWVRDGLGALTGEGPELAAAVARGRHVILLPGGNREANRSFRERYTVDWGSRTGYLRLALQYGMPVVPIAADGVDDTYVGFNNGYALGKRWGLSDNLPAWLHTGPLGPMPGPAFPVKIRQRIGAPLDLTAQGPVDPKDKAALLALHARVTGAVQGLLDELRGKGRKG